MKLEKSNKYNGKRLLNSIKIVLLSSTLLMGCSSVKAEGIGSTPEPTPVATSTPTPIPTPELTRDEEIELLGLPSEIDMNEKYSKSNVDFIMYEVDSVPKVAIVFVGGMNQFEIYNYLSEELMFTVQDQYIVGKAYFETDYTGFVPICFDENANIKVLSIGGIEHLESRMDEFSIVHGSSIYSNIMQIRYTENTAITHKDLVNYYLDIVYPENRVYSKDLIKEEEKVK